MTNSFSSWGRAHQCNAESSPYLWRSGSLEISGGKSVLPYGLGRSYGDSCLNDGHVMVETRFLDKFISFEREIGVLTCEAGVSLDAILQLIVPQGWFLPTTPGTKFVTLGGVIANDIHGKNHHVAGSIGNNLTGFELLRSDGARLQCSRTENTDWFRATIGGLGLTGLITKASIRLKKIESSYIDIISHEFFEISEQKDANYEHTVSWIDCLGSGNNLGRGIYMAGNHSRQTSEGEELNLHTDPKVVIPIDAPNFALNPLSVRAFNTLYYGKQFKQEQQGRDHYESFFYPLDAIGQWNRIYGKRGFYQYQSVVPLKDGQEVTAEMLRMIARSGQASFLAVLKKFGDFPSEGLLSFPRPGITLALDFPNNGKKTEKLFQTLDQIVKEAGGVLYPAKDGRMQGEDFRTFYPNIEEFKRFIDPAFSSSFWRRVI